MRQTTSFQQTTVSLHLAQNEEARAFTLLDESPSGSACFHAKCSNGQTGTLWKIASTEQESGILEVYRQLQAQEFHFLPNFELYLDDESASLWIPESSCIPFSTYLKNVYQAPEKHPEQYLNEIISTIHALASYVSQLHQNGFSHNGITAESFGSYYADDKFLAERLHFLDIHTVQRIEAQPNQDVFAIGTVFFFALTGRKYCGKVTQIPRLLKASPLFRSSESNADPAILAVLTKVLQTALTPTESNDAVSCETFLQELDHIFPLLRLREIQSQNGISKRRMTALKKQVSTERQNSIQTALQAYLYQNPILPDENGTITLCVYGFAHIGQLYLDLLLKVLHFPHVTIKIYVIDPDNGHALYLEQRPELQNFYCINGKMPSKDCYGSVFFSETLPENMERPQQFLVSAASDGDAIQACCELHAQFTDVPIQCALMQEKKALPEFLQPVCLQKQPSKKLRDKLEQMAWNAHLIWQKNLNISWRKIKAEFKQPYNFNSCMFFVLCMRHNLMHMGIDIEKMSPVDAAAAYLEKAHDIRSDLICNEKARWNTDKITDGFLQKVVCEESMADLKTKDEALQQHVCIVPAKPKHLLKNWPHQQWDNEEANLSQLDALEQMSVRLHRIYQKMADEIRKSENLLGHLEQDIRASLPPQEKAAWNAFYHWYNVIKDVFHGNTEKAKLFRSMQQKFQEQLLKKPWQKKVESIVSNFCSEFRPILLAIEYRDYKLDDVALIDGVPFILTYSDQITLAIPFQTKRIMENFYVPMIVNPQKIKYLYVIRDSDSVQELLEALPKLALLKEKRIRSSVEFILIDEGHVLQPSQQDQIKAAGAAVSFVAGKSALLEWLRKRNEGEHFCAVEINDTNLGGFLEWQEDIPRYQYKNSAIVDLGGAAVLSHIHKEPMILVDDIFRLANATGSSAEQPEFQEDYEQLFQIYRSNPSAWKSLCFLLSKNHDTIYISDSSNNDAVSTYRYILPEEYGESVKKVLTEAKSRGIIHRFECAWISSETFEVTVDFTMCQKNGFQILLKKPDVLIHPERIYFLPSDPEKGNALYIRTGSLSVNVQIQPSPSTAPLSCLLNTLKQNGYILNLIYKDGGKITFTYATNAVRKLLTIAGRIFEVYIYHKLVASGNYDDVVNSYVCTWKSGITNEFDLVLTKGLRTILIECKARNGIDSDIIYKLDSLQRHFSSSIKAVLLVDSNNPEAIPEKVRSRAAESKIQIISDAAELEDIATTLAQL